MLLPICFSHNFTVLQICLNCSPTSLPFAVQLGKQARGWGSSLPHACWGNTDQGCKCAASSNVGVRAAEPFTVHISLPHNYLPYPGELRTPLSHTASHLDSNWGLKTFETRVCGSVHYCWWMLPWVMHPADAQRTCTQLSIEELCPFCFQAQTCFLPQLIRNWFHSQEEFH